MMKWVWNNVGKRVVENFEDMAQKQHPRTFRDVGDYFYSKRIAKRFYKDEKDEHP